MSTTPSNTNPMLSTSNQEKWHWGWASLLILIILITLAFRYALPIRDGDIWFHMLYGKYFLENKTLIADHTIFSWTPTTNDTIYCTWLPDIFFYLLYSAFGLKGLFVLRYACLFSLVLGCYLYARNLKIVLHPITWLICLLAVLMSYTAAFIKPEIISYLLMTLLVWNWWHIRSRGDEVWKHVYLFPLIILIWVNSHGGFIFGAVFLFLAGSGELLNTWFASTNTLAPRVRKHLAVALLLAAIMVLVTPYGFHYPVQLFFDLIPNQANMDFNNKVAAYNSPFATSDSYLFATCANTVIVMMVFLFFRNFKKIEWSNLLTNLVFAFLYTRFFRTTFFWVPVFLFSSLYMLSLRDTLPSRHKYHRAFHKVLPIVSVTVCLLFSSKILYNSVVMPEKFLWMGFGISDFNPVTETEYIKKHFPKARIGNSYDQGAYLLWELWPDNKVFFDARHFPYKNWSNDFFNFVNGVNVEEMLKKYPSDLWCIGLMHRKLLWKLLSSGDWKLAFYGKNSAVLVRADILLPANTPRVSQKVFEIRNLASVVEVFRFACSRKDWDTADKILEVIKKTYTGDVYSVGIKWATNMYGGMKAYHQGNYEEALPYLESMSESSMIFKYMLTSCYHYLSGEAWKRGEDLKALGFAKKAWALVPDNPYSYYSLGAILWQIQQMRPDYKVSTGDGKVQLEWREFLLEYLRSAPKEAEFDAFRPLAQVMLDGQMESKPPLLIPPEPERGESNHREFLQEKYKVDKAVL